MSRVLVDSSIWVEMLRSEESPAARALEDILREDLACTNGLIRAEILSGSRSSKEFDRLSDYFSALDFLPDPPQLWDDVARARFRLARKGFQAGLPDVIIAISASHHGKALLTLDAAFSHIREEVPLTLMPLPRPS